MTLSIASNVIGIPNTADLTQIAPGTSNLPSTVLEAQLGEIRQGWDTTLGYGEFIYLKIPTATAVAAGLLVTWTNNYTIAALPALATSKNTNSPVAVAPIAITSVTPVQYGWFQIQGAANVLKTAVAVSPNVIVFASGTAGRVKVLASAGGQIVGIRTMNVASVTSTTSTVLVYLNRPAMQGQVT